MRTLVLGGNGMLGHKVFQRLRESSPGAACTIRGHKAAPARQAVPLLQGDDVFEGVSVSDFGSVSAAVERHRAEVLVNCIGLIKQRPELHSLDDFHTVNSEFPHQLSNLCASRGIRFIHLSTDCVFSGDRGAYGEDDQPDAREPYGLSKLKGEVAGPHALTLRTSFIGRELAQFFSLLEWFLGRAGTTIRGFNQVWFSGVTTVFLAEVLEGIIRYHRSLSGLFHLAGPRISKHELLLRIRDVFCLRVEIVPDASQICDRSLSGERLIQAIGLRVPDWVTLLDQLRRDPTPYEYWRGLR